MRRRKLRWRRRRIRHHHRRCWRHCTRHRATCGGAASATARTARTVSARTRSNACIIIYMRNEMDGSQRSQLIRLFVSSFASLFFSSVCSINRQSRSFCFRLFLVADTRLYTLPCWSVRRSVGPSVGPSVGHISEFRADFAVLLLPNRPRLDCRVSGLVFSSIRY